MNTAKLSSDGTYQTVILPTDFQMTGTEVLSSFYSRDAGIN